MDEASVSLEISSKEQFSKALNQLQKLGSASHDEYRGLEEKYGSRVAEDAGMTPELNPTAEALVEFLQTIPGVEVGPKVKETVADSSNLIASEYAVSATTQRERGGYTGVSVSFPRGKRIRNIWVNLERVFRGKIIETDLVFNEQGELHHGKLGIGEKEGQFITLRGELEFNPQGQITESSGIMKPTTVKKINIPKILHEITTSEGLGKPFETLEILSKAAS